MADSTGTVSRLERRKVRTRSALIKAAQDFIAAGNLNAPILDITQAADVGFGSFYNHFKSKTELFEAAVEDALEMIGELLDQLTSGIDDEAIVFAQSFRLFGRFHRCNPTMSKVFLSNGLAMAGSGRGLAPRLRRDILAGMQAGRFTVNDLESALTIIMGSTLCLGQYVHDHPELDDGQATDRVAGDLLQFLGLPDRQVQQIMSVPPPSLEALNGRTYLAGELPQIS